MGTALVIVACFMLAGQLHLMPVGGEAIGLSGEKLIMAVVANFILGALLTIGIGFFAPCMAVLFALGMSPKVVFPIMMGSCAFLQPAASYKFIQKGAYDRKVAMTITIFGTIGAILAAYTVKEIPLAAMKWVVFVVVIYAATMMFKSTLKK